MGDELVPRALVRASSNHLECAIRSTGADRSELAEGLLPGADRDLHMQNVELVQISGCWKVKVTYGDDLGRKLDEEQCKDRKGNSLYHPLASRELLRFVLDRLRWFVLCPVCPLVWSSTGLSRYDRVAFSFELEADCFWSSLSFWR